MESDHKKTLFPLILSADITRLISFVNKTAAQSRSFETDNCFTAKNLDLLATSFTDICPDSDTVNSCAKSCLISIAETM